MITVEIMPTIYNGHFPVDKDVRITAHIEDKSREISSIQWKLIENTMIS